MEWQTCRSARRRGDRCKCSAGSAHAVFQFRCSKAGREDIDGDSSQLRGTIGNPLRQAEYVLIRRARGDPGTLQVAIVFDAGHMNLYYWIERKLRHIHLRIDTAIVGGKPDVRDVDQKSASSLIEESP